MAEKIGPSGIGSSHSYLLSGEASRREEEAKEVIPKDTFARSKKGLPPDMREASKTFSTQPSGETGFSPIQKGTVERVKDGDTFVIKDEDGKIIDMRQLFINTPEKVELGGEEATEAARKLIEGKKVSFTTGAVDAYGRTLGSVIDYPKEIVKRGRATVFEVGPSKDPGLNEELLKLQNTARAERKGIWDLDRFKEDLSFSSAHVKGKKYARAVNTGEKERNLGEYYVGDGESGKTVPLPSCLIPPGRTIVFNAGKGIDQLDSEKGPLEIYLGVGDNFWNEDGAMVTLYKGKKLIACRVSKGEVAHQGWVTNRQKELLGLIEKK